MGLVVEWTAAMTTATVARRLIAKDMAARIVLVPQETDLVRKAMRACRGKTKLLDSRVDRAPTPGTSRGGLTS
jgi:hypothetical protein